MRNKMSLRSKRSLLSMMIMPVEGEGGVEMRWRMPGTKVTRRHRKNGQALCARPCIRA